MGVQTLDIEDVAGSAAGATHLMLRLGASVQTGAVRSVVKVGRGAVPAVTGSERVSVVVAVVGSEAGQEPRKSMFWEHSQRGGPQVGVPGAKTTRAQVTPLVGAVACGRGVVRVVEAIWLGQSV